METIKIRNCLFCQTQFEIKLKGRKKLYCSRSCRQRNHFLKKQPVEYQLLNKRNPPGPEGNQFVFCVDCNCFFDFFQAYKLHNGGVARTKSLCVYCSKKRKRSCANCEKEFCPVSTAGYNSSYCHDCVKQMRKMHKKGLKVKDVLSNRECAWCLKSFKPLSNRSKCCRRNCQLMFNEYQRRTGLDVRMSFLVQCGCGNLAAIQFKKCLNCRPQNRSKAMQRRLLAEKSGDNGIHWRVVGERDDWVCHLCGGEVLKKAGTAYEPFGATVDHLIPIAKDGTHTWGNVSLAHRRCNVVRGANELGVNYDES